jgi:hypothetical protein
MPTLSERINAAIALVETDADLLHDFIHGDSTTSITTENGTVPSLAKIAADMGRVEVGLQYVVDGGGVALTPGNKGFIEVPTDMLLEEVVVLGDVAGSVVIDIWKDTYANFPPLDADSITAASPMTVVAAIKGKDAVLTGWQKSFAKGEVLVFNLDSVSTFTRLVITLKGIRN